MKDKDFILFHCRNVAVPVVDVVTEYSVVAPDVIAGSETTTAVS